MKKIKLLSGLFLFSISLSAMELEKNSRSSSSLSSNSDDWDDGTLKNLLPDIESLERPKVEQSRAFRFADLTDQHKVFSELVAGSQKSLPSESFELIQKKLRIIADYIENKDGSDFSKNDLSRELDLLKEKYAKDKNEYAVQLEKARIVALIGGDVDMEDKIVGGAAGGLIGFMTTLVCVPAGVATVPLVFALCIGTKYGIEDGLWAARFFSSKKINPALLNRQTIK